MGGGHRKANPKAGKKGPLRGDRRCEEVAGRKRIGRKYREKGPSHIPMEGEPPFEEFLPRERNIIFTLAKRKAIGDKRPQELDALLRIQRVTDREKEEFVTSFKRKGEARGWLNFYVGGDGLDYVFIEVDAWSIVQTFLNMSEP